MRWNAMPFALALLSSCAAEGPLYSLSDTRPLASEGAIYVYRPTTSIIGRGEDPWVQIAGKNMQRLKAGGYVSASLPPGEYDVTARQTLFLILPTIPKTVTVGVAAGSRSYVRVDQRIVDVDREGGWRAMQEVFIEEVDEETGQQEIASARANL